MTAGGTATNRRMPLFLSRLCLRSPQLGRPETEQTILCYCLSALRRSPSKRGTNKSPVSSYNSTHFLDFLSFSGSCSAARMASSNTFLRPFWVRAEHSTYFCALSSLACFSPTATWIGFCLFL